MNQRILLGGDAITAKTSSAGPVGCCQIRSPGWVFRTERRVFDPRCVLEACWFSKKDPWGLRKALTFLLDRPVFLLTPKLSA